MASSAYNSIFSKDEIRMFRLIHLNSFEARDVLYRIYQWGTQAKDPTESLKIYLLDKIGYSNSKLKMNFDRYQLTQMQSDPEGSTFDVTLLSTAIPLACKGLQKPWPTVLNKYKDRLIDLIHEIRDFRNFVAHKEPLVLDEHTFHEKTENLRKSLKKALQIACNMYGFDQALKDDLLKDINERINKSITDHIENWDITNYENTILFINRQNLLLTEGKEELLFKYKMFSQICPASFLTGTKIHLRVGIVFTLMEIIESGSPQNSNNIDYQDILEYVHNQTSHFGSNTDILLIEGIAGSGKTTITKLMMVEWQAGKSNMIHLSGYDLLIYFECRNTALQSFDQLLETLMPKVASKFKDGDLRICVLSLRLLIIADGIDELNTSSKKLLQEILDLGNLTVMTIVCTSRPEYIKNFNTLVPPNQHISHIKIIGIPVERRNEFVTKYHEELKSNGISHQEVDGLIAYLNNASKQLEEHWRLPLNLVLLTIMWALTPDIITEITSATELYTEFTRLKKQRLIKQLVNHEKTRHLSATEIETKLDIFLLHLSWEALINLKDERIDSLPKQSVERLIDACSTLELPHEPVLGTFLVEGVVYIATKPESVFSMAHKTLQDYFGANYIIEALRGNDLRFDVTSILKHIQLHPSFRNQSLRQGLIQTMTSHINTLLSDDPALPTLTIQKESMQDIVMPDTYPKPVTIKGVLEGLFGIEKVPCNLSRFQNTLSYTAGLLHMVPDTIRSKVAEEIVVLFKESGVHDKDQWLDFITEMKFHESVTKSIATLVPNLVSGVSTIQDSRVNVYSKLIPYGRPEIVKINMANNPDESPELEQLIVDLANKDNCEIDIHLHYNFRISAAGSQILNDGLTKVLKRCKIRKFMGRLSEENSKVLPMTIERLSVTVDKWNAVSMSKLFTELTEKGSRLVVLNVHVVPGVDPQTLSSLPWRGDLILYLSDVNASITNWACEIAKRLQPTGGSMQFNNIMFPRCRLTSEEFCELVEQMKSQYVKVGDFIIGGVGLASTKIPLLDTQKLKDFTRQVLGCTFRLYEEEAIWPKITISDAKKSLKMEGYVKNR